MNDILVKIDSLDTLLVSPNKTSYVMKDANFSIKKGSSIGIIGESGSGKTELFKTITGTQRMIPGITNGSVTYYLNNNKEHSVYYKSKDKYYINKNHEKIKKELIGFIPQDPKSFLNPYWTIEQIFKETYIMKKRDITLDQFISFYLNQVDIDFKKYKHKRPNQLSGGEAQRIMVSFVLSKEPQLIIADESSTGLDVTRQRTVIDTFKKIRVSNPEIAMVFISHDLGFLSHVVEEYYVLYGGFICEHITNKNDFKELDKLHPYTKDLVLSLLPSKKDNNKSMHDEVSTTLLNEPLNGCPYYNAKCKVKDCKDVSHFHNEIPPIFNENGERDNINMNKRWKRSL
tara:strand:- start:874 stop:1902 length:1029 start_codon:yes stop_codon:yes gene_type:complete